MIIGNPIRPEDIEVNEVYLQFLIDCAKREGRDTSKLETALARVKDGKDWKTGHDLKTNI